MPDAAAQRPDSFRLQRALQLAVGFYLRGKLEEAETTCRQILAEMPDQFDALHILGGIKLQYRDFAEAVNLLARAVRLYPSSAETLSNLGFGLTELNRHEEALASCDEALAINPH